MHTRCSKRDLKPNLQPRSFRKPHSRRLISTYCAKQLRFDVQSLVLTYAGRRPRRKVSLSVTFSSVIRLESTKDLYERYLLPCNERTATGLRLIIMDVFACRSSTAVMTP